MGNDGEIVALDITVSDAANSMVVFIVDLFFIVFILELLRCKNTATKKSKEGLDNRQTIPKLRI
jgi:hypothetical protein